MSDVIYVKAEYAKAVRKGYPWVFLHHIVGSATGTIARGAWVSFADQYGQPLGAGTFDRDAEICGRIIGAPHMGPADLIRFRLRRALEKRNKFFSRPHYRWVYSEADGLGGVVIDRMGDFVSIQINTQGMWQLRSLILAVVRDLISPQGVIISTGSRGARKEGLPEQEEVHGEIPQVIEVFEHDRCYFTSLRQGQKTGWYFDQRANHRQIQQWLQPGQKVLDLFSFQGGFGLAAALVGADVHMVDCSKRALQMSQYTFSHHQLQARWTCADAWKFLETLEDKYDLIIIDPPALVTDKAHFHRAKSAYLSLIQQGFAHLTPQGILVFASCSSHVGRSHLLRWGEKSLAKNAMKGQVIYSSGHDKDHPVPDFLPSMRYLECVAWQLI